MFHAKALHHAALALAAIVVAAALYLAVQGRTIDAAVLAGFVVLSIGFALWQDRLPRLFTLLFTLVATLNAAGYVFDLWSVPVWFDELVHVVTPFVLISAVAWMLVSRDAAHPQRNGITYFGRILIVGMLIGFAWEGFEYVAGLIGDRRDTIMDLVMDGLGSLMAAAFCLHAARSPATRIDGH